MRTCYACGREATVEGRVYNKAWEDNPDVSLPEASLEYLCAEHDTAIGAGLYNDPSVAVRQLRILRLALESIQGLAPGPVGNFAADALRRCWGEAE